MTERDEKDFSCHYSLPDRTCTTHRVVFTTLAFNFHAQGLLVSVFHKETMSGQVCSTQSSNNHRRNRTSSPPPNPTPSAGLQAMSSSSAPIWFDQAMQTMAAKLMTTREATQPAEQVASETQQELQALRRRASFSAAKPSPKFRTPGLEKQHSMNSKVLSNLDTAFEALPMEAT